MQRSKKVLVVLCAVLLIGSLATAGPAVAGTWYSASGVFGIQHGDEGDISAGGSCEEYGTHLALNPGQTTRLIYSTPGSTYDWPVFFQHKVRWVRVNARLLSADIRVTGVRLYDGTDLLGGVIWGWAAGWKNGYHDIYVDLGGDMDIKKGLRLIVFLQSGVEAASHNLEIHAVSARVD